MRCSCHTPRTVLSVLCAAVLLPAAAAGQTAPADPETTWTAPRTAWGDPDLRGIWDYWTFTPLERPDEFAGKDVLTEEEAALVAQEGRQAALASDREGPAPGNPGGYGQEVWTERGRATALAQPSLIVDPSSGKIPALTPAAAQRAKAQAGGRRPVRSRSDGFGADGPEDRGLSERCLLGYSTGPPLLPGGYNNNVQIFQIPGYVVLLTEMIHDARVIPLDGRPHLPSTIRQWLGDGRGSWEDNTLVVETTNFTDRVASFSGRIGARGFEIGSAENLRLIERFTRVAPDTLVYEFTVDDPTTFTRTFTGALPMTLTDLALYEYACHEGNYGLLNILSGARAEER